MVPVLIEFTVNDLGHGNILVPDWGWHEDTVNVKDFSGCGDRLSFILFILL